MSNEENNLHQQIMDGAYERWQKSTPQWTKVEFFMYNLTPIEKFAVATGNLNYQVCNDGWSQWGPCNQYGTNEVCRYLRSILRRHFDVDNGRFANCGLVLKLIHEYQERTEFDNDGEPKEPEYEEGEEYEEGDEGPYSDMDTRFYAINDAWMVECLLILTEWVGP